MMDFADFQRLFELFALTAQSIFMDRRYYDDRLVDKAGGERVGKLDLAIQAALVKFVAEHRLPFAVVSEESPYQWPPPKGEFLLLDPLDGTHNEASGLGSFGTMLTVFIKYQPVFTMILLPLFEMWKGNGLYCAGKDMGAWQRTRMGSVLWRRIRVSQQASLANSFFSLEGPSWTQRTSSPVSLIRNSVRRTRVNPSLAATFAAIAGSSHAKMSVEGCIAIGNTKPTDNLHGPLIVTAAGGRVTDLAGNPWSIDRPFADMLFTNGLVHEEALRVLASGANS